MLRCLKWLPFACLIIFSLCFGLGWFLGNPSPKPNVPVAKKYMTLIFYAYNINGQLIPATTITNSREANTLTSFSKLTMEVGEAQFIHVKPDNSNRYQERTVKVTWPTREQFLAWLDTDFQQELRARGASVQKWQSALKELKNDAADTSCIYPVVLETK